MANSNFDKIDNNRIASARQVYGVACHFANIHAKNPSERYGLTKVFNAVLNKHYADSDSFMTHGDVTEWHEWDEVPVQFLHMIRKPKAKRTAKKSTASVKSVKTSKKVAKKSTPKGKAKPKTNTQRIDSLESKMDKILEILSAK